MLSYKSIFSYVIIFLISLFLFNVKTNASGRNEMYGLYYLWIPSYQRERTNPVPTPPPAVNSMVPIHDGSVLYKSEEALQQAMKNDDIVYHLDKYDYYYLGNFPDAENTCVGYFWGHCNFKPLQENKDYIIVGNPSREAGLIGAYGGETFDDLKDLKILAHGKILSYKTMHFMGKVEKSFTFPIVSTGVLVWIDKNDQI